MKTVCDVALYFPPVGYILSIGGTENLNPKETASYGLLDHLTIALCVGNRLLEWVHGLNFAYDEWKE